MKVFEDFCMAYCYKTDCPVRTKEKPYPYGKLVENKEKTLCPHCKRPMTKTASFSDEY